MNNFWQVLGVDSSSDEVSVKKAYINLIKIYRPDSDPEKFSEIRQAFEEAKTHFKENDSTGRLDRERTSLNSESYEKSPRVQHNCGDLSNVFDYQETLEQHAIIEFLEVLWCWYRDEKELDETLDYISKKTDRLSISQFDEISMVIFSWLIDNIKFDQRSMRSTFLLVESLNGIFHWDRQEIKLGNEFGGQIDLIFSIISGKNQEIFLFNGEREISIFKLFKSVTITYILYKLSNYSLQTENILFQLFVFVIFMAWLLVGLGSQLTIGRKFLSENPILGFWVIVVYRTSALLLVGVISFSAFFVLVLAGIRVFGFEYSELFSIALVTFTSVALLLFCGKSVLSLLKEKWNSFRKNLFLIRFNKELSKTTRERLYER